MDRPIAWDWPVLPGSLSMSATPHPYLGQPKHMRIGAVAGIQAGSSPPEGIAGVISLLPSCLAPMLHCKLLPGLGTEDEAPCPSVTSHRRPCVSLPQCGRHHSASFLGTRIPGTLLARLSFSVEMISLTCLKSHFLPLAVPHTNVVSATFWPLLKNAGGRWAVLGKRSSSIRQPASQEVAQGKMSLRVLGTDLQTLLYSRAVGILVTA